MKNKLVASILLFVIGFSFLSMAQVPLPGPSPSPMPTVVLPNIGQVIAPAVLASTGIMGWINSKGGFVAAVFLIVTSAFTLLSAVRMVLYKFDGVAPGADIPANLVGLTWVNKICVVLGKLVDMLTGNVAH